MIRRAAKFAAKAHEGTFRKGTQIPYIFHPMEVAQITAMITDDPEIIAAAYLHDVLEDTNVTAEELEKVFGSRVLYLVQQKTEDKTLPWNERKAATIRHLFSADRDVKILTLADKLSNMRASARDYMAIGEDFWKRFNEKRRESHQWYAKGVIEGLEELSSLPEYKELCRLYKFIYGT
ncbi:MAG: HD domain-containing protein [Brotaphodocola sp.]